MATKSDRVRNTCLVALTFASGSIDAMSYLALGRVFTANMTGNVILFGVALGTSNGEAALRSCEALVAFVAGLSAGVYFIGRTDETVFWPRTAQRALWAEIALLVALTFLWVLNIRQPLDTYTTYTWMLIAVAALAMGLQTGTVYLLRIRGVTSTYVTGTLTSVVVDLLSQQSVRAVMTRVGTLVALLAGAVVGAALFYAAPVAITIPALIAVAFVAVYARSLGE